MKIFSLFLGGLGLLSLPWLGHAATDFDAAFPQVKCPAIGEEYEKMIAQLNTIKTSIKDTGNCKHVSLQVDTLQKLLDEDRQKVLDIVAKSEGQSLSPQDSDFVKNYAEGLTKKVASLSDLFLHGNQCFSQDTTNSQLGALAGFVNEASTLVGSVSGPWGAPISLAGNLIAGFLTGLDEVLKSRAGYDFRQRDQWSSYVQNLCTYHGFRQQIEHLLDPVGRIQQLKDLQAKLDWQLQVMSNKCPECRSIMAAYTPNLDAQEATRLTLNDVRAADAKFTKPLGSYTLQNLGLRDWVKSEILRMNREATSEWGNASGQYVLTRTKEQIEDFLIRREAPEFLAFQTMQARFDYDNFVGVVSSEGRPLYDSIWQTSPAAISSPIASGWSMVPLAYFNALILNPIDWSKMAQSEATEDLRYSWNHFRSNSLLSLRASQTTARVALSFCSFFKLTDQFSNDIRSICTSRNFRALTDQQIQLDHQIVKSGLVGIQQSTLQKIDLNDSRQFARDAIEALSRTLDARRIDD